MYGKALFSYLAEGALCHERLFQNCAGDEVNAVGDETLGIFGIVCGPAVDLDCVHIDAPVFLYSKP